MNHLLKYRHILDTPWGMTMYGFKCEHCDLEFYYEINRVRELVTGVPSFLDGIPIQTLWMIGKCDG